MSRVRVFVPCSIGGLARLGSGDVLLEQRAEAHGVTDALRAEFPDADEEELEYLAMTAAAQRSLELVEAEGPYGRAVLAVDVQSVEPAGSEDPSVVLLASAVRLTDLVSVHVDSADAAPAVRAARSALAAQAQDSGERVERCLDHELGWYAATELDEVVRRTAADY